MPVQPIAIQRRLMELGRVRLGEKGKKGEPRKLSTFRFTSASGALLSAVATKYGGTPRDWVDAPNEGMYEVVTDASELNIILPPTFSEADGSPTVPWSQFFELWSAGGCQRRCDGVSEALSGEPCLCNPDDRKCQIVTRISFMLPEIPGLGVWRLDSSGYNAAAELPATLEVLAQAAQEMKFIPAVLRLENRVKKVTGQTRRYVVPVIDLPNVTVGQLVSGEVPQVLNAPRPAPDKPALPMAADPPADPRFEAPPDLGPKPGLPALPTHSEPSSDAAVVSDGSEPGPLTLTQFKKRATNAMIAPPRWDECCKALFPGKNLASLDDEARGRVLRALLEAKDAQGVIA